VRFGYDGGTVTNPDYIHIPGHTLKILQRWIATGRLDGDNGFCAGIITNDLEMAIARAGDDNLTALPQILDWLQHHAPRGSYGSPATIGSWPRIARAAAGSKV
jgi:hypothetical protein